MNVQAIQVHCPYCNAAQAQNPGGNYECEFCLQPFTIVQAQSEESRLLEEIRTWMQDKVGGAAAGGGAVDASSRAYIFQQKMLPDLRRDVDRALELMGAYGQHPLVLPPVDVALSSPPMPNPLLSNRTQILGLKGLRARIGSPDVTSFAVTPDDQGAVGSLERRLSDFMHLSNVVEATARRTTAGYASARRNLETLIGELDGDIQRAVGQPGRPEFLGALKNRYGSLAELCRINEQLCGQQGVSAPEISPRLEQISAHLEQTAQYVEGLTYDPAETMPVAIGIHQEAAGAGSLRSWLDAYGAIARSGQVPFPGFVEEMKALYAHTAPEPSTLAQMLTNVAEVVRAARGEVAVLATDDFHWVDGWIESGREKKSLGLFGNEEQVAAVDRFMMPVWMADVTFSKSTGKVFAQGVEDREVALVDACAPNPGSVRFFTASSELVAGSFASPRAMPYSSVALPSSTQAAAVGSIQQAVAGRPELKNAQIHVRGLAYLPAAVVSYQSKRGEREAGACLGGKIPILSNARQNFHAAQQLMQRFA